MYPYATGPMPLAEAINEIEETTSTNVEFIS